MHITEKRINIDSNWFSAEREVARSKGLHLSQIIDFIEGKDREVGGLSEVGHAFAAGGFLWERVLDRLVNLNKTELFEWLFTQALFEVSNPVVVRPGEQSIDIGECSLCDGNGKTVEGFQLAIDCVSCAGTGRAVIYMTPDGYHIDDMILEEWKHTTKSCKYGINQQKFGRWTKWQIPAYLKSLGLTTCRLRVYFVRGDYTDNQPQWWEYTLEYTQQEIDETWDCIVQHALIIYRDERKT